MNRRPSIRELAAAGYSFARELRLLRLQLAFFLLSGLMILLLALIVASRLFSLLSKTALSPPISRVVSQLLELRAGALLGFGFLFLCLWLAQQWLSAFFISHAMHSVEANAHASMEFNTKSTAEASRRYWPFVFAALVAAILTLAGELFFPSFFSFLPASAGEFISSLAATLLSLALLFLPFRVMAGSSPTRALVESILIFRKDAWSVVRALAVAHFGSLVAVVVSAIPAALFGFALISLLLYGGAGTPIFLLVLLLLIPTLLLFFAGLAFATLFTIGVLACAHQAIDSQGFMPLPKLRRPPRG